MFGNDCLYSNEIRTDIAAPSKYAALSKLTRTLIEKRGGLGSVEKREFLDAGYDESRLLEVVAVLAASTITNYTVNITQPPLDYISAARLAAR
ncbi:hypothetical protein [Mesorhizobium loti]|uniref:hypothetical protein n=1 Tax=Rhizobium loti TaxID=381 RepID=UPI0012695A67|nr:hypothetical protein [Mesorhizobium loti]